MLNKDEKATLLSELRGIIMTMLHENLKCGDVKGPADYQRIGRVAAEGMNKCREFLDKVESACGGVVK